MIVGGIQVKELNSCIGAGLIVLVLLMLGIDAFFASF